MLSFIAWLSPATLGCVSAMALLAPPKSLGKSEDFVNYFPTNSGRHLRKEGILLRAAETQS